MKKQYESPNAKKVEFDYAENVTASGEENNDPNPNPNPNPNPYPFKPMPYPFIIFFCCRPIF